MFSPTGGVHMPLARSPRFAQYGWLNGRYVALAQITAPQHEHDANRRSYVEDTFEDSDFAERSGGLRAVCRTESARAIGDRAASQGRALLARIENFRPRGRGRTRPCGPERQRKNC